MGSSDFACCVDNNHGKDVCTKNLENVDILLLILWLINNRFLVAEMPKN